MFVSRYNCISFKNKTFIFLRGKMAIWGYLNYTLIYNISMSLEINSLKSVQKTSPTHWKNRSTK